MKIDTSLCWVLFSHINRNTVEINVILIGNKEKLLASVKLN